MPSESKLIVQKEIGARGKTMIQKKTPAIDRGFFLVAYIRVRSMLSLPESLRVRSFIISTISQ